MTATINATTGAGGGIVHTSDASGELALQTAGVTALSIDASQNVALTNPLPVASGGSGSTTSTGTGANVLATSPTLVTPILGTPSAVVLTNATGTANSLNAGIGVNQTWQSFTISGGTPQRVSGTTYTNSTSKPIMVSVTAVRVGSSSSLSVVVGGVTIFAADASGQWYGSNDPCFIVPAGATYVVTSSTGFRNWAELR